MSVLLMDSQAHLDRPRCRDVAVASRNLLRRLTAELKQYTEECLKEAAAQARWGTPPVFFFHDSNHEPSQLPQPPALAAQRKIVAELVDDYLSLLYSRVECRRMARAWPEFWPCVNKLAPLDPLGQRLADTLAVADDFVIQVILPQTQQGLRLLLHGVRDMGELLPLVVESLRSQPIRRGFFGEWQFYKPSVLKLTQHFPADITVHSHWFWGTERLSTIPLDEQGERSLILAPATVRTSSQPDRYPTHMEAKISVLQVFNRPDVQLWLGLHEAKTIMAGWSQAA